MKIGWYFLKYHPICTIYVRTKNKINNKKQNQYDKQFLLYRQL